MPPVIAVLLIASCDPSLLHCRPVETWHQTWESTQDCRADRPTIRDRLAEQAGPDWVVLARCRLYLDEYREFDSRPLGIASNAPQSPVYEAASLSKAAMVSAQGGFLTNRSTSQSTNALTFGAWWRPGG